MVTCLYKALTSNHSRAAKLAVRTLPVTHITYIDRRMADQSDTSQWNNIPSGPWREFPGLNPNGKEQRYGRREKKGKVPYRDLSDEQKKERDARWLMDDEQEGGSGECVVL
jgi:hypothetical protein